MRLLVRPSPLTDECLPDFVGRVATLNGLKSDYTIGVALGSVKLSRPKPEYAALGESFPTGELEAIALKCAGAFAFQWRDVAFASGRLRVSAVAVCPKCLAESAARRISWRLRYSRACLIHGCRLLERCPDCRRPIRAGAGTTLRCVCGFDWRKAEALPASEALLDFQAAEEAAELSKYMRPAELAQRAPVRHLPRDARSADLLEAMLGVLRFRDGSKERTAFAKDAHVEEVGRLLAEGPEALAHAVTLLRWNLGHRIDDSLYPIMLTRIRAVRRATENASDNRFLSSIAQGIKTEVANYHRCFRAAPSNAPKDPRDRPGLLNTCQAVRQCGLHPNIFRRLVKKGLVPSKAVKQGDTVVRRFIEPHVVAELNEFRIGLFDLYEASEQLGVSPPLCSTLVKAGVLRGVWGERMRYRDMYRRTDVERILQRLTDVAWPLEAAQGNPVLALTYSRYGRCSFKSWAAIAEGVLMALRGQAAVYLVDSEARGLNRWGISDAARSQARSNALAGAVEMADGASSARTTDQVAA